MISGARVELHAVSKRFAATGPVFEDISFKIEPGEFVTLLGPSGCGKSTLLRLIADLDRADSGTVEIQSDVTLQRSFVFQDATLLPWRSVLQNVILPFELLANKLGDAGVKSESAESRALQALRDVGLGDALGKYPHQLSGGMKMRVSLARALVTRPSLLLLDEPFAALDENTRYALQADLRKLWKEFGMTIVFVTHSLSEAVFLSERILALTKRPASVILDQSIKLAERGATDFRMSALFNAEVAKLQKVFA